MYDAPNFFHVGVGIKKVLSIICNIYLWHDMFIGGHLFFNFDINLKCYV